MWLGLAGEDGACTDALVDAVARVAAGGAGLIISEFASVAPHTQAVPHTLGVHDDSMLPGLRRLVDAVHEAGTPIVLQLVHEGIFSNPGLTGCEPAGPSPLHDAKGPVGREMTTAEIQDIVRGFAAAALRAVKAGFDGVEIHAGHGFLLSQFLSPFFNKRGDAYGGSLSNRARLLLEVVAAIRQGVGPDYPVLVKINSDDHLDGGFATGEMLLVARMLEQAGVVGLEISGGTFYGFKVNNPDITFSPVGRARVYYEEAARRCKTDTKLPVLLDGGIRSLQTSQRLVEEGIADYVCLGRPLIREPDLAKRWESGDTTDAACLSDDSCIGPGLKGKGVYCVHARGYRRTRGLLRFYSGSSGAVNTRRAVAECLENALGEGDLDCDLIIFYTTMGHNFRDILSEVHRLSPHAQIVGSTGSGIIGREGPNESMRALGIMAVRGPQEAFAIAGVSSLVGRDPYEAGAKMARDLKEANPRVNMVLLHYSMIQAALWGPIDRIMRGVESVFGREVPIFGGLSLDNFKVQSDFQFLNQEVFERGAVAVGFADPSLELISGANHGFTVIGEPFVVTRVDRNRVVELDGKQAWRQLTGRLGLSEYAHPVEVVAYAELAEELPRDLQEEYGSPYLLIGGGVMKTDDGAIFVTTAQREGGKLWLVKRDEKGIADGVERLARQLLERCAGRRPVAVFHADCAARGKMSFDRFLKEEIVRSMQVPLCGGEDVPWLGLYGGGELTPLGGRNMEHAFTSSLYVIVERGG
jgi:2,4-dienoyl-CoA reductase-like NADH-dependent reductase (Old Yellow Enzyme family)